MPLASLHENASQVAMIQFINQMKKELNQVKEKSEMDLNQVKEDMLRKIQNLENQIEVINYNLDLREIGT